MKKIVLFSVLLLFGLITIVSAQELNNNVLFAWDLDFMSDSSASFNNGYSKLPGIVKFGLGFLNIFFGLGSYIAGEIGDGVELTITQGVGVLFTGLGFFAMSFPTSVLGIITGIAFLPYVFAVVGTITYITSAIMGFITPFRQVNSKQNSHSEQIRREQQENRRRNQSFNVTYTPLPEGNIESRLTYCISY
ncbi:MAG: hypothetical protein FWD13_08330 [Treponema sp.]|nr:hypothetical protein [Treponema sp.]